MREGVIVAGLEDGIAEISGVHAEGKKNCFADVVFPGFAGDRRNDLTGGDVQEIVVGEAAAKAGSRLHEAQAVDDVVASEGGVRPEEEIAFAESHAAAMREEIANSHFVGDIRVVHLKAREALVDGIVPGDFSSVHK